MSLKLYIKVEVEGCVKTTEWLVGVRGGCLGARWVDESVLGRDGWNVIMYNECKFLNPCSF